jgi:hypothetical protein
LACVFSLDKVLDIGHLVGDGYFFLLAHEIFELAEFVAELIETRLVLVF